MKVTYTMVTANTQLTFHIIIIIITIITITIIIIITITKTNEPNLVDY
jgi:hypothetical protein